MEFRLFFFWIFYWPEFNDFLFLFRSFLASADMTFIGLAVILFKKDEDSVQFTGLKNEEGLSKFLVKQFGDAILVCIVVI